MKKIIITTGLCVICVFLLFALVVVFYVCTFDSKSATLKQRTLVDACVLYFHLHEHYPKSIGELVDSGLLPEKSWIYCAPEGFRVSKPMYSEGNLMLIHSSSGIMVGFLVNGEFISDYFENKRVNCLTTTHEQIDNNASGTKTEK